MAQVLLYINSRDMKRFVAIVWFLIFFLPFTLYAEEPIDTPTGVNMCSYEPWEESEVSLPLQSQTLTDEYLDSISAGGLDGSSHETEKQLSKIILWDETNAGGTPNLAGDTVIKTNAMGQ